MHKGLKEKAIKLRLENQLGYGSIRLQVPVAKSTLSVWLRPFPLSEKRILELKKAGLSRGEASREKFINTMREKRREKDAIEYKKYLKKFGKVSKKIFFISGLILYLAEGSKTNYYAISLANTDPRIIKFFVRWLCYFFKIPKSKLKVQLHLYENMDIEKEKEFWKNELGFNDPQFYKSYITKNKKSSFLYKESFRHGTCSLTFSNTLIKREIMMAIRAYMDTVLSN